MCVCVCRGKSGGGYCVTDSRLISAVGPGYWEFDVLHQKKATCKEVQKKSYPFLSVSVRSLCTFSHKDYTFYFVHLEF